MKLAIATLLVGSAAAFAPAATTVRNTALNMAETATETKVRKCHLYLKRRFYLLLQMQVKIQRYCMSRRYDIQFIQYYQQVRSI